jgi:hypothetical protein
MAQKDIVDMPPDSTRPLPEAMPIAAPKPWEHQLHSAPAWADTTRHTVDLLPGTAASSSASGGHAPPSSSMYGSIFGGAAAANGTKSKAAVLTPGPGTSSGAGAGTVAVWRPPPPPQPTLVPGQGSSGSPVALGVHLPEAQAAVVAPDGDTSNVHVTVLNE